MIISNNDLSKIAIILKDNKVTYQELFKSINQYSQLFKEKNFKKVAIYSENRLEWIYAFYAGWQNGCVVVPVDFGASPDDVSFILNDCKPELIFTSQTQKAELERIIKNLDYLPEIICFGEFEVPQPINIHNSIEPKNIENTAVIIYTSGTTGSPKGVMLSYRNLIANVNGVSKEVVIFTSERQVLMLLPMHHIFPLAGSLMAPLMVGGTIVMSPSMQSSDLIETLKNNRVAILIGVPRFYELLYKGLKSKIDASFIARMLFKIVKMSGSKSLGRKIFAKVHNGFGGNLEFLVSGGAALSKDVGGFFKTLGFEVLEGFGMTEAAPMITFTRPGKVLIGSPGHPLPGLEIKIQEGEILAKGPNIMQGYYNRPEETADVLRDGWLYTGDLGRINKKGYLFITGRKKEIIVLSNGKNINPIELETKLEKSFSCVKEAGVYAQNDTLHALIYPDFNVLSDIGIKEPELYFRETVLPEFNKEASSYKRIMHFTLVKEDLPRTRLGKLQRFKLEEISTKPKKKKGKIEHPDTEEYNDVRSFIEKQVDMEISPDDHLEFDIALDSLGRLSLIDYIETRFGLKFDNERLVKFPSIKAMVEHIREHKIWHRNEGTNWTELLKEKVHVKLPKTWPTQNIIKHFAKGFFRVYFRFKGEGAHNIPDGPCIIAPNHQSFLDGLFVASFIKRQTFKKTYFYAKKKHVKGWFLQFMASRNNVIVMDINNDLKESIQKLAEVLKSGKKVILFPEGTRTKTGEMGEFKKTFAILSRELNVPVVPVAITGAYKAFPTGSKIPKIGSHIQVNFLQPIYPEKFELDTLINHVKDIIEEKLTK
ncbi:MAG TPA: long-chain fatty acid--CoA ligase [Bacteroidales bacterium]|nr:long-chain fatty acid--CoA ligase [Bacteroidales bacterium]